MDEQSIRSRDINELAAITGNVYQSLILLGKTASKIGKDQKQELNEKLAEFSPAPDSAEELVENREQVEIAKSYEVIPKPTLQAVDQLINRRVEWYKKEEE